MTTAQYRKWYFKNHNKYERETFNIVKKRLKSMLVQFDRRDLTEQNYKTQLKKAVQSKEVFRMINEVYLSIGLTHGNMIYNGIKNETLTVKARNALFNEGFASDLLIWLLEFGGKKISTIRDNFIDAIIDFIGLRLKDGKSITVISKELTKGFGTKTGVFRWQMERIARTEAAAAANYAAWVAMDDDDLVIDKVWIATKDHRTRDGLSKGEFDHTVMHNKTVGYNELFEVKNREGKIDRVMYPVDLQRSKEPGNVINCRCTIGPKPRRDKNGKLVRKKKKSIV